MSKHLRFTNLRGALYGIFCALMMLGCKSNQLTQSIPTQFMMSPPSGDNGLTIQVYALGTNGIDRHSYIPVITSKYSIEAPYAAFKQTVHAHEALTKSTPTDGRALELFSFRDSWGIIFHCPPYRFVTGGTHGTNGLALYQGERLVDCFVTTPHSGITPVDDQTLQQGRACDELFGLTAYFPGTAQPSTTNRLPLSDKPIPLLVQGQIFPTADPGITLQPTTATINRNGKPILTIQNDGLSTSRTYLLGNGFAFVETDTNGDNAFENIAFTRYGVMLDEIQRSVNSDLIAGFRYDVSVNTYHRLKHELTNLNHYLTTQEPSLIQALINRQTAIPSSARTSIIRYAAAHPTRLIQSPNNPRYQETIDARFLQSSGLVLLELKYDNATTLSTALDYDFPDIKSPFTLDTPLPNIYHTYTPASTNAPSIIEHIKQGRPDTLRIYSPKTPLVRKKSGSTTWQVRPPVEEYTRNAEGTPIPTNRRRLTTTQPNTQTRNTYRDGKLILQTTTNGSAVTHTYILPEGYALQEADTDGDGHFETVRTLRQGQPLQTYHRRANHSLVPADLYFDPKE